MRTPDSTVYCSARGSPEAETRLDLVGHGCSLRIVPGRGYQHANRRDGNPRPRQASRSEVKVTAPIDAIHLSFPRGDARLEAQPTFR